MTAPTGRLQIWRSDRTSRAPGRVTGQSNRLLGPLTTLVTTTHHLPIIRNSRQPNGEALAAARVPGPLLPRRGRHRDERVAVEIKTLLQANDSECACLPKLNPIRGPMSIRVASYFP